MSVESKKGYCADFGTIKNVEIFSLDRICTVLNCDLDDIVEYVPNNPDIIENAKTAQKEAAASHPVHTPSK